MTTTTTTPLRQRMVEDLVARKLGLDSNKRRLYS